MQFLWFSIILDAWEAAVHQHTQQEVYSQGRIWGIGLGLGQAKGTSIAIQTGGGFCLDSSPRAVKGWVALGYIFCLSGALKFFS